MAAAELFATPSSLASSVGWKSQPSCVDPLMQQEEQQFSSTKFDPTRHLDYTPPSKVHSMEELGFDHGIGVSTVAVSEPFPLFSEEAVMKFREEVLNEDVISKFQISSNLSHCQLRGFAHRCAPFVYDTWKNPEVLRIVSKVAGIDLVPAMDLDISHINLSSKSSETLGEEALSAHRDDGDDDRNAILGWHTDSYPFVCVVMLSDCSQMVGGETALRTGTGKIMKVRGPQMGSAIVLQGRYIEHQALKALGGKERISMVTSFRPKDPFVRDDTVLTSVRPISNLIELYAQFSEYRLEILEERIRAELKEIRKSRAAGRGVSTRKLKAFLKEQQLFLEHTDHEIVDEDQVIVGKMPAISSGP